MVTLNVVISAVSYQLTSCRTEQDRRKMIGVLKWDTGNGEIFGKRVERGPRGGWNDTFEAWRRELRRLSMTSRGMRCHWLRDSLQERKALKEPETDLAP